MKVTPHGQRKCEECVFYHPDRKNRPCSVFRDLQNQHGDCSAYIQNQHGDCSTYDGKKVEK